MKRFLLVLIVIITSLCSISIVYSQSDYIFETGFETGNLSEVGTEITDPATIEVSNEKSHTGTYSAKIYTAEGGPNGRGRIYTTGLGSSTQVNIRAYFYFQEWNGYIQVIRTAGHTTVNDTRYYVYLARVVVRKTSVQLQLGMRGKNPGDWWPVGEDGPVGITVPYNFETGRWYSIEMRYVKSENGEAKVWINNEEVISYYGDTSNSPDVDVRMVGAVLYQTGVDPATIYVDDFVVDDEYIGPKYIIDLDFETGDDSWKIPGLLGNEITVNGSYEYATNYVNSGSYSFKHISPRTTEECQRDGSAYPCSCEEGKGGGGCGRVPIVWIDIWPWNRTKIYQRFYFLVEEWHGATSLMVFRSTHKPLWLSDGKEERGSHMIELSVSPANYLDLIIHPNMGLDPNNESYYLQPGREDYKSYDITVELNKWYYVEMGTEGVGTTNATSRVWFGKVGTIPVMTHEVTGIDLSCYEYINKVYGGVQLISAIGAYDSGTIQYTDDIAIAEEYIGPVDILFSGSLKDKNEDPVKAKISISREGADNIINSAQTDSQGNYELSVSPSTYDIKYDIINFFISSLFLKFLSVNMASDISNMVNNVTGYPSENKVSFDVDITKNQVIQVYSEEEPKSVKANGTEMTRVYSMLTSVNEWFYSSTEQRLYIAVGPPVTAPSPETGLVGYWSFDEGSGSTATDSSGYNNNGNIIGATWSTDCKSGSCLSFDGVGDYVDCGNNESLNIADEITIEAWIKPNDCTDPYILAKRGAQQGYNIWLKDTFKLVDGAGTYRDSGFLVDCDEWQHIAYTIYNSGTKFRAYKNGVPGSQVSIAALPMNDIKLYIGYRTGGGGNHYFNGTIDEVRIYNRVLTAEEILAHAIS